MNKSLLVACTVIGLLVPGVARGDEPASASAPPPLLESAIIDYESGVLAFLQNDGRYGANGTPFGADDVGQGDNLFVGTRLSLELERGAHEVILLYAPLDLTTRVALDNDLQFRDQLFAAGTTVEHRYLFDGYRASYLYRVLDGSLSLRVGGSLQIRNAEVAFTALDGSAHAQESDIGLVPVLKVRARYDACTGAYAMLDADALSTFGLVGDTEGGIYDVSLTLGLPVTGYLDLFLRARALGGGATVPDRELENWAHFLSFTAGLRLDFAAL